MTENIQAGQLCLDDYKNALRGEICDLIGHNPDADELKTMESYAADYVADCVDANKLPDLSGLACALLDCRNEQFKQCAECGEYFLFDVLDEFGYCDNSDCQQEKYRAMNFDPRREWGTY